MEFDVATGLPESGFCKVVQIYRNEHPFLVSSRVSLNTARPFHSDMLKTILKKWEIPFKTRKADGFPELSGDEYGVPGTGFVACSNNEQKNNYLFFGCSGDYEGLDINKEHIEYWKRQHNLTDENSEIIIRPAELYKW